MNIVPLAAESLGVRSAAFFIETAGMSMLIDPGVSLAPMRFGLPPHPLEIKAMNESWRVIKEYAARADIHVITHYHFDHFDPTEPLVLNGKVLLMKHPEENINAKQRERARELIRNFRTLPLTVEFVDNKVFDFGGTSIRFSPALPHGPNAKGGWVVAVSVSEGESRFLHTSDIQGASLPQHLQFILSENPDVLYLDGPLTYRIGHGFSLDDLRASISNICKMIETTRVRTLIIDHHLLRDQNWKEEMAKIFEKAEKAGKRVVTAAGFLGKEDEILEAHRRQLFAWHPDMPEETIRRSRTFQLVRKLAKHLGS
jgi:predicted metallo-beta-lactamase superfamily hydrolase